MMETTKTAAGDIRVISVGKSQSRGGATMFLGQMADGRFVVSSRFQYELKTKDQVKAERLFAQLCS